MATDTRATRKRSRLSLTTADLCQAIELGTISYARRGDAYEMTALDLRRLRRGSGALSLPRLAGAPCTAADAPHSAP